MIIQNCSVEWVCTRFGFRASCDSHKKRGDCFRFAFGGSHVDFLQHKNAADKMLSDHDALMSGICSNRRWIYELCQLGMPRFGELALRLREMRTALASHFHDEEVFTAQQLKAGAAVALNHDLVKTHQELLSRLDSMITRLQAEPREFPGWHAAVDEVEKLVTDICHHEDLEMDGLRKSLNLKTRSM